MLLERGERDAAAEMLANVPGDFQAQGLAARMRLEDRGDPDLGAAWSALDAGDHERAIDALLQALSDSDGAKDDIRQALVAVLDELGVDHPLAREARRRLAAALY
jgi:putative thioredoxin